MAKKDITKETTESLLSLYEATNLVFDYYDSDAIANEIENPELSVESKKKRKKFFSLSRKIFDELEKRLEELC